MAITSPKWPIVETKVERRIRRVKRSGSLLIESREPRGENELFSLRKNSEGELTELCRVGSWRGGKYLGLAPFPTTPPRTVLATFAAHGSPASHADRALNGRPACRSSWHREQRTNVFRFLAAMITIQSGLRLRPGCWTSAILRI